MALTPSYAWDRWRWAGRCLAHRSALLTQHGLWAVSHETAEALRWERLPERAYARWCAAVAAEVGRMPSSREAALDAIDALLEARGIPVIEAPLAPVVEPDPKLRHPTTPLGCFLGHAQGQLYAARLVTADPTPGLALRRITLPTLELIWDDPATPHTALGPVGAVVWDWIAARVIAQQEGPALPPAPAFDAAVPFAIVPTQPWYADLR